MIKTTAELLILILSVRTAAAAPTPQAPGGRSSEYEASARVIGRAGFLEPLAEFAERWQFESRQPTSALTLGAYGRAHRNLKLGVFARVQSGSRHDDDWTNDGAGRWFWRATSGRTEGVLILDATPRMNLGGPFIGSLKIRYEHNTFNGQRTLKLEPEVAWFWLDGLAPKATVFLRHGEYLPLNFGDSPYYERWWYLAGLWHPSSSLSCGPSVALRDTVWSTSADFRRESGGMSYRTLYRAVVWGFTVLLRLR